MEKEKYPTESYLESFALFAFFLGEDFGKTRSFRQLFMSSLVNPPARKEVKTFESKRDEPLCIKCLFRRIGGGDKNLRLASSARGFATWLIANWVRLVFGK